ncbi:hypothetical protein [Massilia eburnea]|uniref:hypothetical protein n=1 Tax=Massilia eburnea TaxID=1776165 RepID=UPI003D6C25A4
MKAVEISDDVKRRAFAALAGHSLHQEALAWPYVVAEVELESLEFILRTRFPEEDKEMISVSLCGETTVLVVSYLTAVQAPQPLSGGGKHYIF